MMKKVIFCSLLISTIAHAYIHFKTPQEALKIVAQYMPENPVILEAGAYDGNDSINLANNFKKGMVYSFEPIPYLYGLLFQKAQRMPGRIRTFNLALSDTTGKAKMFVSEEPNKPNIPSQSSSLLAPKDHLKYSSTQFKKEIEVQTITIDEWAAKNGVDHVDLMWLDMQGYELNALKAAPKILKTVKAILTEVEFVEAYKGQFQFKEVKDWLESQGFTMVAENFGTYGNWFGDALFVRL